jgi:hypothetical protein
MQKKLKLIKATNGCEGCFYNKPKNIELCPSEKDGDLKCIDKNSIYFIWILKDEK